MSFGRDSIHEGMARRAAQNCLVDTFHYGSLGFNLLAVNPKKPKSKAEAVRLLKLFKGFYEAFKIEEFEPDNETVLERWKSDPAFGRGLVASWGLRDVESDTPKRRDLFEKLMPLYEMASATTSFYERERDLPTLSKRKADKAKSFGSELRKLFSEYSSRASLVDHPRFEVLTVLEIA